LLLYLFYGTSPHMIMSAVLNLPGNKSQENGTGLIWHFQLLETKHGGSNTWRQNTAG